MLNFSAYKLGMGIQQAKESNNASIVFKNAMPDVPDWKVFLDHLNEEIHTPMDSPLNPDRPFNERVINGVMMKSLFYMDVRTRNMEKFSGVKEIIEIFSEATGESVYPVSVFINFVANEYSVPKHHDKRETIFWQCQGRSVWHVYPPESDFPVSYTLEPGDIIYVPKWIDHQVAVEEPRAAIAFGYKNEK